MTIELCIGYSTSHHNRLHFKLELPNFMKRLAYFVSHPIQYQAPLLKLIADDQDIDLTVFFFSDFSLKAYHDKGFGKTIKWDIPLTEGYKHHFLKYWGSPRRENWLKQPVATDIYDQLKEGQFDAIWVHGWHWLCSIQAIIAAKRLGIPVMIRTEANGLTEPLNFLKVFTKRTFLSWLFNNVDAFLCVGALNKQFFQKYEIDNKRLFSVPYAVDNSFFQKKSALAQPHREALRKSLGLVPNRKIILYAAKLIDIKRPQDLLAAYQLLSVDGTQEPEPYLLFVGDGVLREHLESIVLTTGWQSIKFLGFRNQSEMPAIYDLCDVFVLPSRFEPWGLGINEVMNAGKAVVVSNQVGCASDLIKDKTNGIIFPVADTRALADAMDWAIANSKLAGDSSLKIINEWGFNQDIQGIKNALISIKKVTKT